MGVQGSTPQPGVFMLSPIPVVNVNFFLISFFNQILSLTKTKCGQLSRKCCQFPFLFGGLVSEKDSSYHLLVASMCAVIVIVMRNKIVKHFD